MAGRTAPPTYSPPRRVTPVCGAHDFCLHGRPPPPVPCIRRHRPPGPAPHSRGSHRPFTRRRTKMTPLSHWPLGLVLLGLAAAPPAAQAQSKKYALLVGVTEYDHPEVRSLKYTENDVVELSKILQGKAG